MGPGLWRSGDGVSGGAEGGEGAVEVGGLDEDVVGVEGRDGEESDAFGGNDGEVCPSFCPSFFPSRDGEVCPSLSAGVFGVDWAEGDEENGGGERKMA